MRRIASNLLYALIFIGAACFLLPSTLMYAFTMIFVVGGVVMNVANWDVDNIKTATVFCCFLYCQLMGFIRFGGWLSCSSYCSQTHDQMGLGWRIGGVRGGFGL